MRTSSPRYQAGHPVPGATGCPQSPCGAQSPMRHRWPFPGSSRSPSYCSPHPATGHAGPASHTGTSPSASASPYTSPTAANRPPGWSPYYSSRSASGITAWRGAGYAGHLMIRGQVAVIYGEALVTKLREPEWLNGTAMHYIFQNAYYGAPPALTTFVESAPLASWAIPTITWATLAMVVSPGNVVISAPCAQPRLTASCSSSPISSP